MIRYFFILCLTFDSTGCNTFNIVLLQEHEQCNDWYRYNDTSGSELCEQVGVRVSTEQQ